MIQREVIDGKQATVAYLDSKFVPTDVDKATLLKVIYDDGGVMFLKPVQSIASKKYDSILKFNENHAPAGSPEGGQFTSGPPAMMGLGAALQSAAGMNPIVNRAGPQTPYVLNDNFAGEAAMISRALPQMAPENVIKGLYGRVDDALMRSIEVRRNPGGIEGVEISGINTKVFNHPVESYAMILPGDSSYAKLELLQLDPSVAGKGAAKDILRNDVALLDKLNIPEFRLYASLDSGAYTWARYGFQYRNEAARMAHMSELAANIKTLVPDQTKLTDSQRRELAGVQETMARPNLRVNQILSDLKTPELDKLVANRSKYFLRTGSSFMKNLMYRTSYGATMDLKKGSPGRKRLEAYLATKKYEQIFKFNPNHEPAGSSEGGQFASSDSIAGFHATSENNVSSIMQQGLLSSHDHSSGEGGLTLGDFLQMLANQDKLKPPFPDRTGPSPIEQQDAKGKAAQDFLRAQGIKLGGSFYIMTDPGPEGSRYRADATPLYLNKDQWKEVMTSASDEVSYLQSKGVDFNKVDLTLSDSGAKIEGTQGITYNAFDSKVGMQMFIDPTVRMTNTQIAKAEAVHAEKNTWFSRAVEIEALHKSDPNVAHETLRTVVRHEMGHVLTATPMVPWMMAKKDMQPSSIRKNISIYASSSPQEAIAEIFATVMAPDYKKGKLPKSYEDLVDWMIKGKEPKKKAYGSLFNSRLPMPADYDFVPPDTWGPPDLSPYSDVAPVKAEPAKKSFRALLGNAKKSFANVLKFNPNHDDKGRFATGGLNNEEFGDLDRKIINYDPKKPLDDPKTNKLISSIIPGARVVPYSKTPFFQQLLDLQGVNLAHVSGYEHKQTRDALFQKQPVKDIPIDKLIFTQNTVNMKGIERVEGNPNPKPAQVVYYHGDFYLMDGHHRTVADIEKGVKTLHAYVLDLDHLRKSGMQLIAHKYESILKFNPNHDEIGRFSSGDSAASQHETERSNLKAWLAVNQRLPLSTLRQLSEFEKVIRNEASTDRDPRYVNPDGSWTPERKALQSGIMHSIATEMEKYKSDKPTVIFLGGRSASGKGSFTNGSLAEYEKQGVLPKMSEGENFYHLDADEIQKSLPGYSGSKAPLYHEESSQIFDAMVKHAMRNNINVVLDVTMKSAKYGKIVDEFKDKGFTIEGHFMHLGRGEAAYRAAMRSIGKTGRYVPPSVVLQHTNNEEHFHALKSKFTRWSYWDNSGRKPRLVSHSD